MDAKETHYPPREEDDDELMRLTTARSASAHGIAFNSSIASSQMMRTATSSKVLLQNSPILSPQPSPPPVAMSLRARETASMALKHIFDAAAAAAAAARDESTHVGHHTMGGFHQGMRNQSMPELRKHALPELDLTFKKDTSGPVMMAPPAPTGFGSPISTPTPTTQNLLPAAVTLSHQAVSSDGHHVQHNTQVSSSAWAPPSNMQSTHQMTIFYSGNVNVYDDVPADKAHALMCFAGNSWSSNSTRCPAPAQAEISTLVQLVPPPTLRPAPTISTIKNSGSVGSSLISLVSPPTTSTPTLSPLATPPPSPAPSTLADNIMTSPLPGGSIRRPNPGIELPHARKASLARFLVKRKDRVQVQQVNADQQEGAVEEKSSGECNCGKKLPDTPPPPYASIPTGKKPCARSCSASPSRSVGGGDYEEEDSTFNRQLINEHYFFQ